MQIQVYIRQIRGRGGKMQFDYTSSKNCCSPTLKECEDETQTPKIGTWESFETPKTSEFNCKGPNSLHWGVIYIIEKLSKCRCRKWARMDHLDI
jgi:hypothetical protein